VCRVPPAARPHSSETTIEQASQASNAVSSMGTALHVTSANGGIPYSPSRSSVRSRPLEVTPARMGHSAYFARSRSRRPARGYGRGLRVMLAEPHRSTTGGGAGPRLRPDRSGR
jgi:hypothetical protein